MISSYRGAASHTTFLLLLASLFAVTTASPVSTNAVNVPNGLPPHELASRTPSIPTLASRQDIAGPFDAPNTTTTIPTPTPTPSPTPSKEWNPTPAQIAAMVGGGIVVALIIILVQWFNIFFVRPRGRRYQPSREELRQCWATHGRGRLLQHDWWGRIYKVPEGYGDSRHLAWGTWREVGGEWASTRQMKALFLRYGHVPDWYLNSLREDNNGGGG